MLIERCPRPGGATALAAGQRPARRRWALQLGGGQLRPRPVRRGEGGTAILHRRFELLIAGSRRIALCIAERIDHRGA